MKSTKWKNWIAIIDEKTCKACKTQHGTIYGYDEPVDPKPPLHIRCRCSIDFMRAVLIGTMISNQTDYFFMKNNTLPDEYITKKWAKEMGWIRKKNNLMEVAPNKILGGDVFHNLNNKLPDDYNRIWYEADVNVDKGIRGLQRLLFSNDGLLFITFDHYETFIEIISY